MRKIFALFSCWSLLVVGFIPSQLMAQATGGSTYTPSVEVRAPVAFGARSQSFNPYANDPYGGSSPVSRVTTNWEGSSAPNKVKKEILPQIIVIAGAFAAGTMVSACNFKPPPSVIAALVVLLIYAFGEKQGDAKYARETSDKMEQLAAVPNASVKDQAEYFRLASEQSSAGLAYLKKREKRTKILQFGLLAAAGVAMLESLIAKKSPGAAAYLNCDGKDKDAHSHEDGHDHSHEGGDHAHQHGEGSCQSCQNAHANHSHGAADAAHGVGEGATKSFKPLINIKPSPFSCGPGGCTPIPTSNLVPKIPNIFQSNPKLFAIKNLLEFIIGPSHAQNATPINDMEAHNMYRQMGESSYGVNKKKSKTGLWAGLAVVLGGVVGKMGAKTMGPMMKKPTTRAMIFGVLGAISLLANKNTKKNKKEFANRRNEYLDMQYKLDEEVQQLEQAARQKQELRQQQLLHQQLMQQQIMQQRIQQQEAQTLNEPKSSSFKVFDFIFNKIVKIFTSIVYSKEVQKIKAKFFETGKIPEEEKLAKLKADKLAKKGLKAVLVNGKKHVIPARPRNCIAGSPLNERLDPNCDCLKTNSCRKQTFFRYKKGMEEYPEYGIIKHAFEQTQLYGRTVINSDYVHQIYLEGEIDKSLERLKAANRSLFKRYNHYLKQDGQRPLNFSKIHSDLGSQVWDRFGKAYDSLSKEEQLQLTSAISGGSFPEKTIKAKKSIIRDNQLAKINSNGLSQYKKQDFKKERAISSDVESSNEDLEKMVAKNPSYKRLVITNHDIVKNKARSLFEIVSQRYQKSAQSLYPPVEFNTK